MSGRVWGRNPPGPTPVEPSHGREHRRPAYSYIFQPQNSGFRRIDPQNVAGGRIIRSTIPRPPRKRNIRTPNMTGVGHASSPQVTDLATALG